MMILHDIVSEKMAKKKYQLNNLLVHANDELSQYDLTIWGDYCPFSEAIVEKFSLSAELHDLLHSSLFNCVNLECPITTHSRQIAKKGPALKAPHSTVNMLKSLNINMCSLANNHIMDYGSTGLKETTAALHTGDISIFGIKGIGNSLDSIIHVAGLRIGFVSFTENEFSTLSMDEMNANPMDCYEQLKQLTKLKSQTDFIIVQYHGGVEYYPYPTPKQQKYARFLADAGASLVICHHSHRFSGYEDYDGVPIFYGLGNFFFPESGNPPSWYIGLGIGIRYRDKVEIDIIPVSLDLQDNKLSLAGSIFSLSSEISEINKVIGSETAINKSWLQYCAKGRDQILKTILRPNLLERLLSKSGLFNDYLKNKVTLGMFNTLRCESHYERVLTTIRQILGVL